MTTEENKSLKLIEELYTNQKELHERCKKKALDLYKNNWNGRENELEFHLLQNSPDESRALLFMCLLEKDKVK